MISYERIEINNSKGVKCMYDPYVCNRCHDFSMTVMNLSNFFILNIEGFDDGFYISGIDKKEAANIINNSDVSNKGVL